MAELDILAQIDLAVVDSPLHFHTMFVACTAPSGFYFHDFVFPPLPLFFGFLCFTMFYPRYLLCKSHNQQAISAGPIHDGATTTIVLRTASAQFASSTLLSFLFYFPYPYQLLPMASLRLYNYLQDQLISIKRNLHLHGLLSRVSLTLSEYLRVVAQKFGPHPSCY